MFTYVDNEKSAKIKVIGVGGAGGNAINNMIASNLQGVKFIAANTDAQALEISKAPIRIQLGEGITAGLGAGANPQTGRDAALENEEDIREALADSHMVFITAGFGGGTGTGAAPVIAEICKDLGALTVAVVTKPFSFEGKKRTLQAERGIEALKQVVDTAITIPNDRLRGLASKKATLMEMFIRADENHRLTFVQVFTERSMRFRAQRIFQHAGQALPGRGRQSHANDLLQLVDRPGGAGAHTDDPPVGPCID